MLHMVLRNRMFEWNTLCTLRELSKLLIKYKKAKYVLWPEFFFILMITLGWAIHPDNVVIVKAGYAGSDHNVLEVTGNWIMLLVLAPIFVLVEGHGQNIPWNPTSVDFNGWDKIHQGMASLQWKQLTDTSCDVPLLKDVLFFPWFNRAVKCYAWYPGPCKCVILCLQLTVMLSVLDSHNEKYNCMCLISLFFFPSPSPEESRSK